MARTTLATPSYEAQTTLATQSYEAQAQASSSTSTMPVIALVVRLITFASLVVSTSLLASNSTTISGYYSTVTVHSNDVYAYRYALATSVIGLAYTLLQLPFSINQVGSWKLLMVDHTKLVVYEFLADKVVLALVATGVGAAFGATVDLKRNMDEFEDWAELNLAITTFSLVRSKLDDFFNRAYFPAIFLLIALLTSGVSSVLSSLALTKRNTN